MAGCSRFDGRSGGPQTRAVTHTARARWLPLSCCFAWLCLGSALVGCGDDGPHFVPASANPGQNLMVIDEGFDLTAAEFSGKLVAAYTFACGNGGGGPSDAQGGGPLGIDGIASGSFDQQKQEIIAALATRDDSCHLRAGISHKSDPLSSVARFRTRWNAAVKDNQPLAAAFSGSEQQVLFPAVNQALSTFPFHGTATAGTAAHENDTVRLVLVERPLGDESTVTATYTCVAQADLDRFTALYGDPAVMVAAASQPQSTLDADLDRAIATHAVGLVNESFGSPARLFLEQLQAMYSCPATDFTGYFVTLGNLEQAQRGAAAGPAVLPLTVHAAGNDGAQIDSVADAIDCDLGDPVNLSVGSLALDGTVSTFSNRGACVDLYAPGESIVTPVAGGWYFPVDGTSFAGPLAARTLSLTASTPYDAATAKQQLLAQNAANNEAIPPSAFPGDLFYQPVSTAQALVDPAAQAPPPRWKPPVRVDLRRMLGPLERRRRGL